MIIVVEGTDNAGKTTVALKIAKKLKAIFLKSENIPPEAVYLPQYQILLDWAEQYGNGYVVSDRHHAVSDPIYGPIVRGYTTLNRAEVNVFLKHIDAFVYCRPPDEKIVGTMLEREQMAGVDRNIRRLIESYDKFFEQPEIRERTWIYDWTKDSEQLLIEEIKRYA